MRTPPNKSDAGRQPGVGSGSAQTTSFGRVLNNKDLTTVQASVLTAIPANHKAWRLKAISPAGETAVLPHLFANRWEALGAGVMLARAIGAEVLP